MKEEEVPKGTYEKQKEGKLTTEVSIKQEPSSETAPKKAKKRLESRRLQEDKTDQFQLHTKSMGRIYRSLGLDLSHFAFKGEDGLWKCSQRDFESKHSETVGQHVSVTCTFSNLHFNFTFFVLSFQVFSKHLKLKPFACKTCGVKYAFRSSITGHLRANKCANAR